MEERVCDLCGRLETGNFRDNLNYLMCSDCVQRLLATPDDIIREGIKKLREKGMMKKAQMLENFIGKEVISYGKKVKVLDARKSNQRAGSKRSFDRARYERASRIK